MTDINSVLTLLFTANVSLKTWDNIGNLDREIELYKRLSQKLKRVNIITYGGKQERKYASQVQPLNLLPTIWSSKKSKTLLRLLFSHMPEIIRTDIIKTNQIPGSEIAVWLKKHLGKKIIIRCGYLHSYFAREETNNEEIIQAAIQLENTAFLSANLGIVTSQWQRDLVIDQSGINPDKIKVVPNYVMTEVFKPEMHAEKLYDLAFVGRAGRQKNIPNLLHALKLLKAKNKQVSLIMIGSCCNDMKTRDFIDKHKLNVTLEGNIPHHNLPKVLNQSKIFVFPSLYEGHPKALLEAMSCGLPCIGSDVQGIRNDIQHMNNGYLCQTDSISISEAIENILSDDDLQKDLGKNAREYILENYTLDRIVQLELGIIKEILSK